MTKDPIHPLQGRFASDPYVTFHGKSVVNKEHAYYYGNSLGGILGEVYMAATQDVVRGVSRVYVWWWVCLGGVSRVCV